MQSLINLSRSLFQVVLRGGSAQRIQYEPRRLVVAVLSFVVLAVVTQVWGYGSGPIETGLFLFTVLSGFYIGAALLTRKAPRLRLQVALLTGMLTLCLALLPLLLLIASPAAPLWLRGALAVLSLGLTLSGITSAVRHALGGGRGRAFAYALAWLVSLAAFYGIMYPLIQIVFS